MQNNKNITDGESSLMSDKIGHWVSFHINTMIAFTQSERDVLNLIRYFTMLGCHPISLSMFKAYTGLTDKTVTKAISRLESIHIIEKGRVCKEGTFYSVNYKVLRRLIIDLNRESSAIERVNVAKKYRSDIKNK